MGEFVSPNARTAGKQRAAMASRLQSPTSPFFLDEPRKATRSLLLRRFQSLSSFAGANSATRRPPISFASSSSFWFSQSSCAAGVAEELTLRGPPASKIVGSTLLQPGVVIYDGVCHLCHRGVKLVIHADKYRKIKFYCLRSQAAEPYLRLSGLTREDVLRRFLFVESPGMYYQASTAALKVASHLPLPYSALSALLIIPRPIRDAIYDYIAKKRYDWFGKEDDCIVIQEEELLERFIDWEEMLRRKQSNTKP